LEKPLDEGQLSKKEKVVTGSSKEIAHKLADEKEKLMEPGAHSTLIFNDLKAFREIHSQYSRAYYLKIKSLLWQLSMIL
jgi:hypothetical protein